MVSGIASAELETGTNPYLAASKVTELTHQEQKIVLFISQGLSNDQIGARMHLSVKTVKNHLTNAFRRLDVQSRTQIVVRAHRLGIIDIGPSGIERKFGQC